MDQFTERWRDYLRRQAQKDGDARNSKKHIRCDGCGEDIPNDLDVFSTHVQENPLSHPEWKTGEAIAAAFAKLSAAEPGGNNNTSDATKTNLNNDDLSSPNNKRGPGNELGDRPSPNKKSHSPPPASVNQQRPRDRQETSQAFSRGASQKTPAGKLWSADQKTLQSPQSLQHRPGQSPSSIPHRSRGAPNPGRSSQAPASPHPPQGQGGDGNAAPLKIMLQPETRPISQDHLVAEVKGIYAGLVMVETKCIEVDNVQASNREANAKLNNEQWQALIALHRTLLHEHHDFFLASQHPSASPALRRLASKYAMPARMWRHGIHSFLELLRYRLPASLEHMLTFLYLAYSMMALLYETVPAFEDTWIECLGDLGRYRMAIEDDNIRDREVWTGVSRHWYSKASDKAPTTGRLYHHLAILARPNALQQLYYYTKSLCVPIPFLSARESILTLFDPILSSNTLRLAPIDAAYVRVHGILFSGKSKDRLDVSMDEFLELLDNHIGRTTKRWLESGYYIGISLGCSLLEYGSESNVLMKAMAQRPEDTDIAMEDSAVSEASPGETFEQARSFAVRTYTAVLTRWGDTNTLPFIHTTLVFLRHLTHFPAAMSHIEQAYPWKLTALMLNSLLSSCDFKPRMDTDEFPRSEKDELPRPLTEDFALRGLLYADHFPADWFSNDKIDEDEKYFELASMVDERKERILWLGRRIATSGKWLTWDEDAQEFWVTHEYDIEVEGPEIPTDLVETTLQPKRPSKESDLELLPDAPHASEPEVEPYPREVVS